MHDDLHVPETPGKRATDGSDVVDSEAVPLQTNPRVWIMDHPVWLAWAGLSCRLVTIIFSQLGWQDLRSTARTIGGRTGANIDGASRLALQRLLQKRRIETNPLVPGWRQMGVPSLCARYGRYCTTSAELPSLLGGGGLRQFSHLQEPCWHSGVCVLMIMI